MGTALKTTMDPDRDGDGVANQDDVFPEDSSESSDLDGDGIGDNADPDRDGDGVANEDDVFPSAAESSDLDGDGVGDNADPDRDGDGVANEDDVFPEDSSESSDLDGDGIGDNADPDRDGDGVAARMMSSPKMRLNQAILMATALVTTRIPIGGDDFANDEDAFPDDPAEWIDTDLDGIGNNADTDDDNDGVLDEEDGDQLAANAPVIAPIDNILVLEGDTFITAITVTDADNSELDVVVEGADADAVMLSDSGSLVCQCAGL